jgi:hypothetical protein
VSPFEAAHLTNGPPSPAQRRSATLAWQAIKETRMTTASTATCQAAATSSRHAKPRRGLLRGLARAGERLARAQTPRDLPEQPYRQELPRDVVA